jgi:hypothetical protein
LRRIRACTAEISELFLVGGQLGQDPALVGDLDDVGDAAVMKNL